MDDGCGCVIVIALLAVLGFLALAATAVVCWYVGLFGGLATLFFFGRSVWGKVK